MLDDDVASFDVPEVDESSTESLPKRLGRAKRQHTDAGNCVRRLRLDAERRGEEADRDAGDECPPIHHSIT